jgi:hypothetical protein
MTAFMATIPVDANIHGLPGSALLLDVDSEFNERALEPCSEPELDCLSDCCPPMFASKLRLLEGVEWSDRILFCVSVDREFVPSSSLMIRSKSSSFGVDMMPSSQGNFCSPCQRRIIAQFEIRRTKQYVINDSRKEFPSVSYV